MTTHSTANAARNIRGTAGSSAWLEHGVCGMECRVRKEGDGRGGQVPDPGGLYQAKKLELKCG